MNHLSGEVRSTFQQACGVRPRGSFSLPSPEEGVGVFGFASLIVAWIVGFVLEVQPQILHHLVDAFHRPEQDGVADVLIHQLSRRSKNGFLVAFRENNPLAFSFDLIDHLSHDRIRFTQPRFQLLSVPVDVEILG